MFMRWVLEEQRLQGRQTRKRLSRLSTNLVSTLRFTKEETRHEQCSMTDQCYGEPTRSVLSEMRLLSSVCPSTRSNWAAALSHAALAMTSVVCA